MPNILAKREVVPECVQEFDPPTLAKTVLSLPEKQDLDLSALGSSGAAERAARALYHLWHAPSV